jgi:polyisoprenoid-binding protein YceI
MAAATAVRTGVPTWQLDPAHSSVEFAVKHMMMTTVRGRFKDVRATVTGDETRPETGRVEVVIQTASIDTGSADRDAHLRSADFFDAETYPTITFRNRQLEGDLREEGDRFRLIGDLQIRDTTMEVVLDCEFLGHGKDPWGKERGGFTAKGEIDRRDWGLKWNQAIETGGVLVANRVRIEAEVQFVRQDG